MKKIFTNLVYVSDCGNYKVESSSSDIDEEITNLHLHLYDLDLMCKLNDIKMMRNFFSEMLVELNIESDSKISTVSAKPAVMHDPRFAPDPDGVLGF